MKWGVEMTLMIRKEYVFETSDKEHAIQLAKEAIDEESHPDSIDFDYMVYEVDDTHTFQGERL
jgi:hypothetical protein